MKRTTILTALLISLFAAGSALGQGASIAHIDLMHIWRQADGTPNRMGYLPLANQEAKTALLNLNLAIDSFGDPVKVNTLLANAVHALDPEQEATGDGLGFGLTRAAAGILAEMQVASMRPDASPNVKRMADPIMQAADHVVQITREARILADDVRNKPGQSSAKLIKARDYITTAMNGHDDDGDGKIAPAESGLKQISEQMADLLKDEGF